MTTMNKTTFCRAMLAALGTLGMMNSAHAVNLNPLGLGQVLLYPYYTVRNGFDTYVSVVNATTAVKAVRVRFLEGKNARPVLDFNLYLSPQDIWTGAVTATPDGAKLVSVDKSCTTPQIPAEGVEFSNKLYSGSVVEGYGIPPGGGSDGSTQSLDRTREGYFEVLEMGVVTNTTYVRAITHTAAGVPANCALLQDVAMAMTPATNPAALAPPTGHLSGTASLVNVAKGIDFGYDATALAAFYSGPGNLWAPPGSEYPGLHNAFPNTSVVIKGGMPIVTTWLGEYGEDAVSAVLMTASISNNYTVEPGLDAATDWIVTMPTKRYYVPVDQPAVAPLFMPFQPFTATYWDGACEEISLASHWDREEQGRSSETFYPERPVGSIPYLCWASTIVSFNASTPTSPSNMPLTPSTVLGSTNLMSYPGSNRSFSVGFQNGQAQLSFTTRNNLLISPSGQTVPATASGAHTYQGLPTIGFMVESFKNNNAQPGVLATYGGNFNHKTTSVINGLAAD